MRRYGSKGKLNSKDVLSIKKDGKSRNDTLKKSSTSLNEHEVELDNLKTITVALNLKSYLKKILKNN
jgi:hypothetical protein